MVAKEQSQPLKPAPEPAPKRRSVWRVVLGIALSLAGIWLVTRNVNWSDLGQALLSAEAGLVLAGFAVIVLTSAAKAWRWRFIFYPPANMPPYRPTFWAIYLGQFINNTPVRVGELARAYTLSNETNISTAQAVGTVIVEKSLDLLMMVLTLALLLVYGLLPGFIDNPGLIALTALVLLLLLYALTYQTNAVIGVVVRVADWLPQRIGRFIVRLATSGLKGLAALRSPRLTLVLLAVSILIAFLSVLTPAIIFRAFDLPFGLAEAALLHLALTVSINIPSTPGRIGVFEGTVYIVLRWLGMTDDTLILGFALVFHLVVLLPQLVLGGYAAARSKWNWRDAQLVE